MADLKKWQEKLLDMGKRNKLINYKDAKSSSMEVLMPEIEDVFKKMSGDRPILEVYDYERDFQKWFGSNAQDVDSVYDDMLATKGLSLNKNDKDSEFPNDNKMSRDEFVSELRGRFATGNIKKGQVVLFNNSKMSCVKTLKSISKKAKEMLVEKGINVLYLSFGMLNWRESEDSNIWYKSPLVLIPVKITNESADKPFYIERYEDEVITNQTLKYKLSSDYNIILPEMDEDSEIEDYLSDVSKMAQVLEWSVSSEVKLSTFSFSKINMYLDIKDNEATILKNCNVKSLLGISDVKNSNNETSDSNDNSRVNNRVILHSVVDADSSQEDAIILAKSGKSFVLQGPPGTGKSQTITNIIADSLACNKKVLFVSEKLAALSVVFSKLKHANLDDFCLELHSNKTDKKSVVAELNRTLSMHQSTLSSKAQDELDELISVENDLNKYATVLHAELDTINMSLYKLYGMISKFAKAKEIEYVIKNISLKGDIYLKKAIIALNKYVGYENSIGYNYKMNSWYGYVNYDCSYAYKIDLKNNYKTFLSRVSEMQLLCSDIKDVTGAECSTIHELARSENKLEILGKIKYFTPKLVDKSMLKNIIDLSEKSKKISDEITTERNIVEIAFNESIYSIDIEGLLERYTKQYTSIFKVFKSTYKSDKNELKSMLNNVDKKLTNAELIYLLKHSINVVNLRKKLQTPQMQINELLQEEFAIENADWQSIIADLKSFEKLALGQDELGKIRSLSKDEYVNMQDSMLTCKARIHDFLVTNEDVLKFISNGYDSNLFGFEKCEIKDLEIKINCCLETIEEIDNWLMFVKLIDELKNDGLIDFVDKTIAQNISVSEILDVYRLSFYKQWVHYVFEHNKILSGFDRLSQDSLVERFKNKDRMQFDISKAYINAELSKNRPNMSMVAAGSAVSVLIREGVKKRKLMPIRVLFEKVPELIRKLKPCLLMSPLSVSTYLGSDTIEFDLVIFDEASQIFPEDALGAIYRAKQVIVVGDSKQMPPSNFFSASAGTDEDDNDYTEDVGDYESILDMCSQCYRKNSLKWHYRSRSEDLIAFSNKNYYKNELITFPSSQLGNSNFGVSLEYVEDGIYDRTSRSNRKEAERVADLVFEHFEANAKLSIGVVSFSQSQQDLIDYVINKRRELNPEFEKFFKEDVLEPFFVKNLETVQGDERDVIIFSVGYAKSADGKFLHNFGPLNKQGGERRLNVAVTRAKCKVVMVSSIKHFDIDEKRTSAIGAKHLKEYLDFAENGIDALRREIVVDPDALPDSDFEVDVYDVLVDAGYKVDMQVGSSGYKIDLAVKHPKKHCYVLAVECDGAAYHSSKTARDRDRLRQEILERLGWTFYRVWSTDWFKTNKLAKERLLQAVKDAIENFDDDSENASKINMGGTARQSFSNIVEPKKMTFDNYVQIDEFEFRHLKYPKLVERIVAKESPISAEWIMKRTIGYFGREKVTNVVREEFNNQLRFIEGIKVQNDFLYWSNAGPVKFRIPTEGSEPRKIEYIAVIEIVKGMRAVIEQNIEIDKDSLFRAVSTYLGYGKLGAAIIKRFELAIEFMKKKELIMVDGDNLSLNKLNTI